MNQGCLERLTTLTAAVVLFASAASAQCAGDCDGNGMVDKADLLALMEIGLGHTSLTTCGNDDADPDARVDVHDLLTAVNRAASGCAATPTPTSTPVPGCATAKVTVRLAYDPNVVPELAGLTLDLKYPVAAVGIPGSRDDDSVVERVTDVSGAQGFASVMDLDSNSDGQDDQVHTAYAGANNIPPGPFQEVQFDCVGGAPAPSAEMFTCIVSETVDSQANPVSGVGCEISLVTTSAPTPTTVASATPTATVTPVVPTPTQTGAASVCGNNTLEAGETCDDGNTVTNPPTDSCPADCTITTCTPAGTTHVVSVSFTPPEGKSVASIGVLLEYPDGTVQIPGTGDDESVGASVGSTPNGFFASSFDYDYALSGGLAGTRALTPGQIFRVTFVDCTGAAPPMGAQFKCTVTEASSPTFQPVSGVTCSAALL